jgi:hypothetical protein
VARVSKLERRVAEAAEAALARSHYVAPVELFTALGWVRSHQVAEWRQGRVEQLADVLAVDEDKLRDVLRYLTDWAGQRALRPAETEYLAGTRDRRRLRFTAAGRDEVERALRTHWVSPELSEKKRARLEASHGKAPDLVVLSPLTAWKCQECGMRSAEGELMCPDGEDALCLSCADFDHLRFLPSGNAALSRRAKKESTLSAVVLRFNRRRKRYERQGILVEEGALERAETQCLADEDIRARRRERDADRRAAQDVAFQSAMASEIRRLYPGCPGERALEIAEHAGTRGSGRVGRSAAGRALDEHAVRLAVIASVRHRDTGYDAMLMAGVARDDARDRIRDAIDAVLTGWESA